MERRTEDQIGEKTGKTAELQQVRAVVNATTTLIKTMNGMSAARRWNVASAEGHPKHSTTTETNVEMSVGNWRHVMNVTEVAAPRRAVGLNLAAHDAVMNPQSEAHVQKNDVAVGRVDLKFDGLEPDVLLANVIWRNEHHVDVVNSPTGNRVGVQTNIDDPSVAVIDLQNISRVVIVASVVEVDMPAGAVI